ncbi:MAG: hypothetical protein ACLFTE_09255 [Salinivenus sp.]
MPSAANLFWALHWIALAAFVGVTSVAMLVAVVSRLRVRQPLLVWRTGPLVRLPLGPSLFLLLVAGGIGYAWFMGRPVPTAVLLGYPAGGVFWFVATWLAQSVIVTEHGVIPDVTRLHRAVPWRAVVDYVSTTRNGQPHFIFVYHVADGPPRRLDLPVPPAYAESMRDLVRRKLDARFSDAVGHRSDIRVDRPDESDRP